MADIRQRVSLVLLFQIVLDSVEHAAHGSKAPASFVGDFVERESLQPQLEHLPWQRLEGPHDLIDFIGECTGFVGRRISSKCFCGQTSNADVIVFAIQCPLVGRVVLELVSKFVLGNAD